MRQILHALLPLALVVTALPAYCESLELYVEKISNELLDKVHAGRATFDDSPAMLYKEIEGSLIEVVDFPSITRGVMGAYFKDSTAIQRKAFEGSFRTSIVELFTKTLIVLESEEISVLPLKKPPENSATVIMKLLTKDGESFQLVYSMSKQAGVWRIRNIIVNGINLGLLYRNQFKTSMKHLDNRIDDVIRQWKPKAEIE